jgi:hypothetical protein
MFSFADHLSFNDPPFGTQICEFSAAGEIATANNYAPRRIAVLSALSDWNVRIFCQTKTSRNESHGLSQDQCSDVENSAVALRPSAAITGARASIQREVQSAANIKTAGVQINEQCAPAIGM